MPKKPALPQLRIEYWPIERLKPYERSNGVTAKLILPPCVGRLLVPYSGSGSEVMGAMRAGWDSVTGIELDSAYTELAERRITGDSPLFNEPCAVTPCAQ